MKRRIMVSLLCIAFALLFFDSVFAQQETKQKRQRRSRFPWKPEMNIGDKVQDFELQLLDGGTFKLSEKKGTIIVIELGACS